MNSLVSFLDLSANEALLITRYVLEIATKFNVRETAISCV